MPISNLIIENTQIDENLEQSVKEMIIGEKTESENMPQAITDYIGQKIEGAADDAKEAIADSTAHEVALTMVKAGTWIILFIVARILLILLRFITSLIAKLPVIKQFDKVGRNYIWCIGRINNYICITCNYIFCISNDEWYINKFY